MDSAAKPVMRVAVCEDDEADAEALHRIVLETLPCEVLCFASGEAFLEADPAGRFDLVFMDVFLGGLSGVEISRRLREADERVEIAFVTTSEAHALDGYAVRAARYIVKPFERAQVAEALRAAAERAERERGEVLSVVENRRRRDLPLRDILYVAAERQVCVIHTLHETLRTYAPLEALAASLPAPRFLRCHRAYIVNLDQVRRLEGGDFLVSNGDRVYISVRSFRKMRAAYEERLFERARGKVT